MAKKKDRPFLKKGAAKNFLYPSGGSVEDEAKREKRVFPFGCRRQPGTHEKIVNSLSSIGSADVRYR
jgi:hypothetical protein